MKEIKLVSNSIWMGVAMIITAIIIAGAGVFAILQYNKTQWDIANLQKEAQIKASNNIKDGLDEVGRGFCKTSAQRFTFC